MSVTTLTATIAELEAIGGSRWAVYGKDRIYFEAPNLYGLQYDRYKTGNIKAAWLDGERISNSECGRLLSRLFGVKVFVECADMGFHVRGRNGADYYDLFLEAVNDRLAELRAAKQAA